MPSAFIGQLALVPYSFAPQGWAFCNGQLLPITQYQALFALIGTTYGGDGKSTFALPDMRGRVPVSSGQGPGLTNYPLGQKGGAESVTLTEAQLPAHSHSLNVHNGKAEQKTAAGNLLANAITYSNDPANGTAAAASIANAGAGQPHDNRQPYIALNWIIALFGDFPAQP
jgi:microcystin-dependent protein